MAEIDTQHRFKYPSTTLSTLTEYYSHPDYGTDLNVEGSNSNPIIFKLKPPANTRFYIKHVSFTFVGTGKIRWDRIFNLGTLDSGIILDDVRSKQSVFRLEVKRFIDILSLPSARVDNIINAMGDTIIKINTELYQSGDVIQDDSVGDYSTIEIRDDLTKLKYFTVSARGVLELFDK